MIDGKPSVAVCIPVAGARSEEWWVPTMKALLAWQKQGIVISLYTASAGMLDMAKDIGLDNLPEMMGKNWGITSENRNALANQVIENGHDYVFFIDHDTVVPTDTLPRLLNHNKPFVCGIYYHRNNPHLPLMYRKRPNGLYSPIRDFERGALFEVDATGMGIALIHLDVFRSIRQHYVQFERYNGTRVLIHEDDIKHEGIGSKYRCDEPVTWQNAQGAFQVIPLRQITPELETMFPFPFFDMENLRTEDIGFCERAIRCGFRPVVDTTIEAVHWHWLPIDGEMFRTMRGMFKENGLYPAETVEGGIP